MKGSKIRKTHESRLHAEWINTTILTSIDDRDEPLTIRFRLSTNNQYDFRNFIAYCVSQGVLRCGDTLVMDNARIHKARDTFQEIQQGLA